MNVSDGQRAHKGPHIYSERGGGRQRQRERGERKLTWVGVNGTLGFCLEERESEGRGRER